MCGIAGIVDIAGRGVPDLGRKLQVMNALQKHRGPDDAGTWQSADAAVGLGHRRLTIIDLSTGGHQPMCGPNDTVITYNGEIYNYLELREQLAGDWSFRTRSDTETILAAYARHGVECPKALRGMFAFGLWDARERRLICARDRFGIKPFYYTQIDGRLYFASEIKALIPFLPQVETDPAGFAEYLTFQYTINERTLFAGVRQLAPGHMLVAENGRVSERRYWDVHYDIDHDHSPAYFEHRLRELVDDSVRVHLRSDVPIGATCPAVSIRVSSRSSRAAPTPVTTKPSTANLPASPATTRATMRARRRRRAVRPSMRSTSRPTISVSTWRNSSTISTSRSRGQGLSLST